MFYMLSGADLQLLFLFINCVSSVLYSHGWLFGKNLEVLKKFGIFANFIRSILANF